MILMSKTRRWWFSCKVFTIYCETNSDNNIVYGAAIINKFKGRHVKYLVKWMKKLGGFRYHEYK